MEGIGFSAYLTKPARQAELFDSLSAVLAPEAAAPRSRPLVTRHAIREMRRGAVRILLAEDNITNQQVAVGILQRLGLRADAVANGAEAVRALESLPYDLVLMDVQMPELDGLAATRAIRTGKAAVLNPGIPIVAMTAHAMRGDRERCLEAGMNDYIAKPVSIRTLAAVLDKWLPREGGAAPAMPAAPSGKRLPPSVSGPGQPVFDRAGMLARLMDDRELADKVIAAFLGDMPRQIGVLRDCVASGDAAGAGRQAHTIKGACANVGGDAMREAAMLLEAAAKAGRLEGLGSLVDDLQVQLDALKSSMAMDGKNLREVENEDFDCGR
jgi:CheY-like chemotaxis protein/HPt (histidine-containing phosphotransfer) domain-containing protein